VYNPTNSRALMSSTNKHYQKLKLRKVKVRVKVKKLKVTHNVKVKWKVRKQILRTHK
jgi:hypothetical protein